LVSETTDDFARFRPGTQEREFQAFEQLGSLFKLSFGHPLCDPTPANIEISYCAVYPPSTGHTLAVTNEASSEARNATTDAISSGWPIRPIG